MTPDPQTPDPQTPDRQAERRPALPLNGLAPGDWKPPSVESLPAWRILRGVRFRRQLNQRELAAAAKVQRSTVERIEAQLVQPRYDTMLKLLGACGYVIVVADAGRQYDPICEDRVGDGRTPRHTFRGRQRVDYRAGTRWNDAT